MLADLQSQDLVCTISLCYDGMYQRMAGLGLKCIFLNKIIETGCSSSLKELTPAHCLIFSVWLFLMDCLVAYVGG